MDICYMKTLHMQIMFTGISVWYFYVIIIITDIV